MTLKKSGRRLLGVLLAAAVAFSSLPLNAQAEEGITYLPAEEQQGSVVREWDGESGTAVRFNEEELGGGSDAWNTAQTFSAQLGSYDDGSMYGQLSSRQKACYDALEEIGISRILTASQVGGARRVMVRVDDIYGIRLSGTISGGKFEPASTSASLERDIYSDLCAAIVALRYDRPDILWMSRMSYGYKSESTGNGTVKVTDVIFDFYLEYGGQEKDMWETMMAQAREIAGQVDTTADSYTQVKTIHDILAERNSYNTSKDQTAEALSHLAYSGLVSGDSYEPVCDGYSKAFKVVCDLLDISCVLPSSQTHMWNNVKMDDGDWYNLDLTWDDGDDEAISYDYFLIGSQTVVSGQVFSREKDHVEENPYQVYYEKDNLNPQVLRFPTKNKESYSYLGEDYPALVFPDVKRSAWYYEAVMAAYDQGLFAGDKNGMFQPGRNITRAEFAKVMANSMGVNLDQYSGSSFTDVKEGKWYAPAVAWAKEAGLMLGYQDGTFHPDANISRQEMCVVLYNAMGKPAPEADAGFRFPDDAKIAGWADSAVYACYGLGLVKGDSSGNFAPKASTMRSEAATVFTRYTGLEQAPAA